MRPFSAALADPKIKAGLGSTAFAGSPADVGELIAKGTETWAKAIALAGKHCVRKVAVVG